MILKFPKIEIPRPKWFHWKIPPNFKELAPFLHNLLALVSVCTPPTPYFTCCNHNAQCDGVRRQVLWNDIRSWRQNPHDEINTLTKEIPWSSPAPSTLWGCKKSAMRRESSPNCASTLISDFQPSELWDIKFCCLSASQSVIAAQTDWKPYGKQKIKIQVPICFMKLLLLLSHFSRVRLCATP